MISNSNKSNDDIQGLLRSPSWTAAITGCSVPAEAWRRLLSRHLKLAAFVGDQVNHARQIEFLQVEIAGGHPLPIHAAASQGLLKAGATLLALEPANLDVRDGQGRSALHWAAMTDHSEFVKMLLERGATVDARECSLRTPLMTCSAFGATNAARLLLQSGADPNAGDNIGLTPLHACAGSGHIDTAEMLLCAGADHLRRAAVGASARNVAERQGHAAMVKLLATRGSLNMGGAGSAMSSCADDSWSRFDRHSLLETAPRRSR